MFREKKKYYVVVVDVRENHREVHLYYGRPFYKENDDFCIAGAVDYGNGIEDSITNKWFAGLTINEKGKRLGTKKIEYTPIAALKTDDKHEALGLFIGHKFKLDEKLLRE